MLDALNEWKVIRTHLLSASEQNMFDRIVECNRPDTGPSFLVPQGAYCADVTPGMSQWGSAGGRGPSVFGDAPRRMLIQALPSFCSPNQKLMCQDGYQKWPQQLHQIIACMDKTNVQTNTLQGKMLGVEFPGELLVR